jgi:hypothetical protein
MCKNCIAHPENRNSRYCDDWWKDTSHGGYAGDRALKDNRTEHQKENDKYEENYWDNDELSDGE